MSFSLIWSHSGILKPRLIQWKGINRKQSTRWQHLSRLKASAFFSLQNFLVVMKHSNLYLGLVLPSGGWQSLILASKKSIWWYKDQSTAKICCKVARYVFTTFLVKITNLVKVKLSIMTLPLYWTSLCWVSNLIYCYEEFRYAECHYAKCQI